MEKLFCRSRGGRPERRRPRLGGRTRRALAIAGLRTAGPNGHRPRAPDLQSQPRPIGEATTALLPGPIQGGGFDLPNGWRITPAGQPIADLGDLVLKMVPSPDGKVIVAGHGGYLPHGLSVIDAKTHRLVQEVPLKTAWLGLAWSADGHTLYVSGGNANGEKKEAASLAPIYALAYRDGRLDPKPTASSRTSASPPTRPGGRVSIRTPSAAWSGPPTGAPPWTPPTSWPSTPGRAR